jgi:hypothetical protein
MYAGHGTPAGRGASAPAQQGFIVLGLLVAVTVCMVTGALIGQIIHQHRYGMEVPLESREVRYSERPVEIRYGALTTGRIAKGDSVWVRPTAGGQLAVFAGRDSQKIVGFVTEGALLRSPPGALGRE